jgi:nucleoside-diphosphate-sugar epimerase
MRVFLTGGTGLLGSHLAELLTGEGHDVVALVRPDTDTRFLEGVGCVLVEGDVRGTPESLGHHMSGCSHVVHGAALVYAGASWPEVREVNVIGTRNVLQAAADAGVRHAVHVSSVSVYGRPSGAVDEDAPIDGAVPSSDLYTRSKRGAEAEARAVETERGIPVTVVRPAAVYGERDRLFAPRIGQMTRWPIGVLLGDGQNTLPAVYSGNVADAIRLVMEAERGGATYDIGMDHPLTQERLLRGIAQGMGRNPKVFHIPEGLVLGAADLMQTLRIPTPGAKQLPIGRVARLALGENPYPSRRIREELGWDPPHRHEDALERTGRWLRGRL